MSILPEEIIMKICTYLSSPTADIMKPYIKSYNKYSEWISYRYDTMTFPEYMSVNAQYLDFTSKRHLREPGRILKTFVSYSND